MTNPRLAYLDRSNTAHQFSFRMVTIAYNGRNRFAARDGFLDTRLFRSQWPLAATSWLPLGATPPDNSFLHLGLALRAKSLYFPLQVHPFFLAPRVSTPSFLATERMRLFLSCHPQLSVIALNLRITCDIKNSARLTHGALAVLWLLRNFESRSNSSLSSKSRGNGVMKRCFFLTEGASTK